MNSCPQTLVLLCCPQLRGTWQGAGVGTAAAAIPMKANSSAAMPMKYNREGCLAIVFLAYKAGIWSPAKRPSEIACIAARN
jgi:hypothetical protein